MATEKQIEANRRNALKSTGPRTEAGRAAVRFNSLKHGLSARSVVIPGESAEEFEAHLDRYFTEKSPTTAEEEDLVLQMAVASWCKRRLYRVIAAFYAYELEDHKNTLDEDHPELNGDGRVAYIVRHQDNRQTMTNLSRYQAQQERSFRTASEQLCRLRRQALLEAKAAGGCREAESPAEPEETKALVIPIGFASQKRVEPVPAAEPPTDNSQQPSAGVLQSRTAAAPSFHIDTRTLQSQGWRSRARRGPERVEAPALNPVKPLGSGSWLSGSR